MAPKGPGWQDLTWSWAYSTGHAASDQKLEAGARAAWPYSLWCAWTYLNDRDMAHDLMDDAVHNTARYLARHPESPANKLTSHLKSVIRRRAKQLAAERKHEIPSGSLLDLEQVYSGETEPEERVYAIALIARLSPFAQSIVNWRWLGYSWREIAGQLDMDHTAVRRAYFRELESVLHRLSRPGDSPKCD